MSLDHLSFIYAFEEDTDKNKVLEDLSDGTLILSFSIPGRPSTKKTSQRVVRRGGFTRILPSLLYEKYEKHCKEYCESIWKNKGYDPIDYGVSIKLKVYLDSWIVGDECGYQQANGDIIQTHGIIKGFILGLLRIIRCNPFSGGGFNPVPQKGNWFADVYPNGSPRG